MDIIVSYDVFWLWNQCFFILPVHEQHTPSTFFDLMYSILRSPLHTYRNTPRKVPHTHLTLNIDISPTRAVVAKILQSFERLCQDLSNGTTFVGCTTLVEEISLFELKNLGVTIHGVLRQSSKHNLLSLRLSIHARSTTIFYLFPEYERFLVCLYSGRTKNDFCIYFLIFIICHL